MYDLMHSDKPKTTSRGDVLGVGSGLRGCAIGRSQRMNIVTIGDIPGPGR